MGGAGVNTVNGMPDMFPYGGSGGANSPGFGMSPGGGGGGGNSFPMFSPASNGVDIGGPNGFGQNAFNPSAFHGPYMNPYAWPSGSADPSGNPTGGLPYNPENQPALNNGGPNINLQQGGNPGKNEKN